jgi:hypothetical protein
VKKSITIALAGLFICFSIKAQHIPDKKKDGTPYIADIRYSNAILYNSRSHPGYYTIKGEDNKGRKFEETDYH